MERKGNLKVVPIPFLDFSEKLEVYKVHNLPMPFVHSQFQLGKSMTVKFELESSAIAVDTKHTKFILLDEEELEVCSKHFVGFCVIKSALYPLNVNQYCITAMFINKCKAIARRC